MRSRGLGLDIVEIGRIRKLARSQPRFLSRVFSAAEIAYCRRKRDPWPHFAVRFAAKEAVWKAMGASGVALKDISVRSDTDGRPSVLIRNRRPRVPMELSLSHSDHYAVAVALISGSR